MCVALNCKELLKLEGVGFVGRQVRCTAHNFSISQQSAYSMLTRILFYVSYISYYCINIYYILKLKAIEVRKSKRRRGDTKRT